MKKLGNGVIWLLVPAGAVLLAWVAFRLASETYAFSRYGVEKTAHVLALDHVSRSTKGGNTFYYFLEMDGRRFVKDFRGRLPEGRSVSVLSLPHDPTQVILGTNKSSTFDIFSGLIGGHVMAVLAILLYGLLAWAGPSALVEWFRKRRQIING
jgi:hypothetical protein